MYASMKMWWMSGEWEAAPVERAGAMVIPTPVITHIFTYINLTGTMLRRVQLSLSLHGSMLRGFILALPLHGRMLRRAITSINLRASMLRKAVTSLQLKGLNLDFLNKVLELLSLIDLSDDLEKVGIISPLYFYINSFKRRLLGRRKPKKRGELDE